MYLLKPKKQLNIDCVLRDVDEAEAVERRVNKAT
jgi:hypothetical protein